MSIRDKIEAITKKFNITQNELAERVDVNRATISQIKGGARMSTDLKNKIIKEFSLEEGYFDEGQSILYEPLGQYGIMSKMDLWKVIDEQSATIKEQSETIKLMVTKLTAV